MRDALIAAVWDGLGGRGETGEGVLELELHQIELRYAGLRRRNARKERALLSSLSERGQLTPVIVVVRSDAGAYVLVDGYKRVRALTRLHQDTVFAVLWDLPEQEALLLATVMRNTEADSALEQGWLLKELHQRFGLSTNELGRRFDKSQSWVSRRLALVEQLPQLVQELVRKGELSAHAAMKHLVPMARANLQGCLELAPVLAGHGLSSRQVGTLCAAFLAGTNESRRLILSEPQLVLRAEEEAKRPKDRSSPERLLDDVAAVAAICRRARRLVLEEKRRGIAFSPLPELSPALCAAEADTSALFTLLRTEMPHAGSKHAHRHPQAS